MATSNIDSHPMNSDNQIQIPQSFVSLYMAPHKTKPRIPWSDVMARYDLCEDLANMLTHTAGTLAFDLKVCDTAILDRCHSALQQSPAAVSPAEARWTIYRLAELMGWELPIGQYPDPEAQADTASQPLATA